MKLKELFILHFLNDGIRTTFVVLLPFIAKDLSFSLGQAGFLGSSQPLIAALLAIPTGFIMSKFGGFRIILSLLLIYSLAAIAISFSFNISVLFLTYFASALGFGMFHTIGFALTAQSSTHKDVGRNMGNFTSIGEIGRISIPPLAVFTTSLAGWRPTIAILGIIGAFLFFVFKLLSPGRDNYSLGSEKRNDQNYKSFFKDLVFLFKRKHSLFITSAAIVDSLASSPIYVYLPFLLVFKGNSPFQLGIAMAGFFIGSLAGKTLLGRSVDKFGNFRVFIISELCMAVSLFLIAQTSNFFILVGLASLLGIFTKGTSPVVQTMFSQLADKEHYHKVYAVSELATGLSAVVTIVIMGIVADRTGINTIFYVCSVLAVVASFPIYIFSRGTKA